MFYPKEIPVSVLDTAYPALLCLNTAEIPNPQMLEKALLLVSKWSFRHDSYDNSVLDVTDSLCALLTGVSGSTEFRIPREFCQMENCRLLLFYYQSKIYPTSHRAFFERKFWLNTQTGAAQSPWFWTAEATSITFFIQNLAQQDLQISIDNSPDGIQSVKEKQRLLVAPGTSALIIPAVFSKYTRIEATSAQPSLTAKLTFQMQSL